MSNKAVEAILARHLSKARSYGAIEALAGITDRMAFWADKNEDEARLALRQRIRERIVAGELQ